MKNKNIIFILLLISLTITACSSEASEVPNETTVSSDANKQLIDKDVDIDLTQMSSTMIYSQIYDLMINPTTYLDQTIKVVGQYQTMVAQNTGITYNFVVVNDATGCCPQGIEFIYEDTTLPEPLSVIELIGTFESYQEGDLTYYRISAENIVAN